MTSRPRAADDFIAIRARMAELKLGTIAGSFDLCFQFRGATLVRIWPLSEKAQALWPVEGKEKYIEGNIKRADWLHMLDNKGLTAREVL